MITSLAYIKNSQPGVQMAALRAKSKKSSSSYAALRAIDLPIQAELQQYDASVPRKLIKASGSHSSSRPQFSARRTPSRARAIRRGDFSLLRTCRDRRRRCYFEISPQSQFNHARRIVFINTAIVVVRPSGFVAALLIGSSHSGLPVRVFCRGRITGRGNRVVAVGFFADIYHGVSSPKGDPLLFLSNRGVNAEARRGSSTL